MKKTNFLLLILSITLKLNSQTRCAFDSIRAHLQSIDTNFAKKYDHFKNNMVQQSKDYRPGEVSNSRKRSPSSNMRQYVIPVAVHIVHKSTDINPGNGSNISNAQVQNQIDELNKYFKPYHIAFCLASRLPDGTAFNGITRTANALTNYRFNADIDDLMKLDFLPTSQYLNIWVVNSILEDNGSPSGYMGAALDVGSYKKGITMRYDVFGNATTCNNCNLMNSARGKVLVHEVGHYLGLYHTFEGGCAGKTPSTCDKEGDKMCDTPPMIENANQCVSSNTCTETPVDANDPYKNYMNYKEETCLDTFSPQQVAMMYFNIENYLDNVIHPDNLNFVLGGTCNFITPLFTANQSVFCDPGTVTLKAIDTLRQYHWSIYNKTLNKYYNFGPNSTNFLNFSVNDIGIYDVTLTVWQNNNYISRTIKNVFEHDDCGSPIVSDRGNWYFGHYAGLKFRSKLAQSDFKSYYGGDPSSRIEQNLNSDEGCIVQNNKAGGLLFYGGGKVVGQTDSFYLFDKTHSRMPNATNLIGASTSMQGGISIPVPGSGGRKYYVFTTNSQNVNNGDNQYYGLRYNIVDTLLNGGKGDVVAGKKNLNVKAPANRNINTYIDSTLLSGEGICAIPGCDSSFYYLIVTSRGYRFDTTQHISPPIILRRDSLLLTKTIEIYKVDSNSVAHFSQYWHNEVFYPHGFIVASKSGRLIIISGLLFEFDKVTGKLKFLKDLTVKPLDVGSSNYYSAEFSSNERFLYLMYKYKINLVDNEKCELHQIDLSNGYYETTVTTLKHNCYSMENGPDGKLYITQVDDNFIGVVESPNTKNDYVNQNKINYKSNRINLRQGRANMRSMGCFPNFVDAVQEKDIVPQIFYRVENCNNFYFYTTQCCKQNYVWDFGDGDTSHSKTATHQYSGKKGKYLVQLTIDNTIFLEDSIEFGFDADIEILGEHKTCDTVTGSTLYVKNPKPEIYKYSWETTNGNIKSESYKTTALLKMIKDSSLVTLIARDKYHCKDSDQFLVVYHELIHNNLISVQNVCDLDTIYGTLPYGGNGTFSYNWYERPSNNVNWQLLNINQQHYLPTKLASMQYMRLVKSGNCISYSNFLNSNPLGAMNRIYKEKFYDCAGSIAGVDVRTNFPNATYQWQVSYDKINFSNLNNRTMPYLGSFINDTIRKYYRRIAISGICTTYSNIDSNIITRFERQPTQEDYCLSSQKMKIGYKLDYPEEMNMFVEIYLFKNGNKIYLTDNNITQTDSTIILPLRLRRDISLNIFDTIKPNDSLYLLLVSTGCGYDKTFKSKNIIYQPGPTYINFTSHPANASLSSGQSTFFTFGLTNKKGIERTWQSSPNNNGPWTDIQNSNFDSLIMFGNACAKTEYFRVKVSNVCTTIYSNSAKLSYNSNYNPQFDYWLKDNPRDFGIEPQYKPSPFSYFESPDIWVRHKKDGVKKHQEINVNQDTNWVYVTIRNRKAQAVSGATINLYWSLGSSGQSWSRSWTNNPANQYRANMFSPRYPKGNIIAQKVVIPPIAGNKSVTIAVPCTNFPKAHWYKPMYKAPPFNVCLLGRIETCSNFPFGMFTNETSNTLRNVSRNNNIAALNTYTKYFINPGVITDGKYKPNELVRPPNQNNGGVILVENLNEDSLQIKHCVEINDSTFFEKAEIILNLSPTLYQNWMTNGNQMVGYQNLGNGLIKLTHTKACIENLNLSPDFSEPIEVWYGYKDLNDRFENNEIFKLLMYQTSYNGDTMSECLFKFVDNPFVPSEPTYIETDTTLTICNNGVNSTQVEYIASTDKNYVLYDDENQIVNPSSGTTYNLNTGEYMLWAVDTPTLTHYITYVHVPTVNEDTVELDENINFDCDALPYHWTVNDETYRMYEYPNTLVDTVSWKHYELNPVEKVYYSEYKNLNACHYEITHFNFMDNMTPPENPAVFLVSDFDRTEDSCVFVKLNEITCAGDTIQYGREFEIYDLGLQYLYTATVTQYGNHTKGFRFCPPHWNTDENHINDWHMLIYKVSMCNYCRIDFKPDSLVVLEKILNLSNTITNAKVLMFPNPANETVSFVIENNFINQSNIIIYDQSGKMVMSQAHSLPEKGIITLSIDNLSQGVYQVYIPDIGFVGKLVVVRD